MSKSETPPSVTFDLSSIFFLGGGGGGGAGGEVFPGVFHIKMIMWGVFNISFYHKNIYFNSILKYLQSKVAFRFHSVECRPLLDCVRSLNINGHSPLNTESQYQRYRQTLSIKSPDMVWYLG